MNNFNALSQHMISINQSINTIAKTNYDLTNRLNVLEKQKPLTPSVIGDDVILKMIDDAVSKIDISALVDKAVENLNISGLIEKKINIVAEEIENKIASKLKQNLIAAEQIIIDSEDPLFGSSSERNIDVQADDDIIIGIKEEKKTVPKKKPASRQ